MKWKFLLLCLFIPHLVFSLNVQECSALTEHMLSEWNGHLNLLRDYHQLNPENYEQRVNYLNICYTTCQEALNTCNTILNDISYKTKKQQKGWRVELKKERERDQKIIEEAMRWIRETTLGIRLEQANKRAMSVHEESQKFEEATEEYIQSIPEDLAVVSLNEEAQNFEEATEENIQGIPEDLVVASLNEESQNFEEAAEENIQSTPEELAVAPLSEQPLPTAIEELLPEVSLEQESIGTQQAQERLKSKRDPPQNWEYTYEDDYLVLAKDPLGRIHSYAYDSEGRILSETVGTWKRLYRYDARGLILSAEQSKSHSGIFCPRCEHTQVDREYDADGGLIQESIYLNFELLFHFNNGETSILAANPHTKVAPTELDDFDKILRDIETKTTVKTTYDLMGQICTQGNQIFEWDPWGHLLKVYDGSTSWEASYDAFGRRIQTRHIP